MSYETVIHFSETWGLVYLFILFLGVLAYAFWPSNRSKFDKAAMAPFEHDDHGKEV